MVAGREPVRPDYDGSWVGGLVPSLLGRRDATWLPDPVADARSVVLLVLDGLGWSAVESFRDRLPALAAMEGGPITTVAPSTTSAALTSISTGLSPAEHGVTGYRMRVGGSVLNVLGWYVDGARPPSPASVQPHTPFLGEALPVVTRMEFATTGFTTAHLRGARLHGWLTTSSLVEQCRQLLAAGERLVYAYYDGIDKVAHAWGLRDGFYAAELAAADRLVAALTETLDPDSALLVVSDHGQVHVGPEGMRSLEQLHPLVGAYSGEGRFRTLYARQGAGPELVEAARSGFGDVAWVWTREQLFDEGLLGPGGSAEVRGRVGDVVLAARAPVAFADPGQPFEAKLMSQHGSLTAEEMLVPLLATRGSG